MDPHVAAREAAVFIDIENVFGTPPHLFPERYDRRVRRFLDGLPRIMGQWQAETVETYAFARVTRVRSDADERLSLLTLVRPEQQIHLTEVLWPEAAALWCRTTTSDEALIAEVTRRLADDSLPHVVGLVTDDTDFIPLAQTIVKSGRQFVRITARAFSVGNTWRATGLPAIYPDELYPVPA